ncbi:MAG: lecithin retinol acyltransferase family protein [Sporichthyaceae bacterium]
MNPKRSDARLPRTWDPALDAIPLGAHLVFVRRTYEHHALYAGGGMVLEYTDSGGVHEAPFAEVRRTSRYWVLCDSDRRHPALFTGPEALERARARCGERLYSRGENNCEHLVNWALSGHHHCDQTDSGVVYVGFGFVSWLLHVRKAAWHRARLASAYPAEQRIAAHRYAYYRTLRDKGVDRATAAEATRRQFASVPLAA